MATLGIGKTLFNSSACRFGGPDDVELILTERLTRQKASGAWPAEALLELQGRHPSLGELPSFENRDLDDPAEIEKKLNLRFPFFEALEKKNLKKFSRHLNPSLKFVTHHLAHASAAAFMSPFEKSLILVIDGAGSRAHLFKPGHPEYAFAEKFTGLAEAAEERSLYAFENGRLTCLEKNIQTFKKSPAHAPHFFSEGLGSFYEKISEFIFASKRSAGKVMGLAALGTPAEIGSPSVFLESLDWKLAFRGSSKKEWQESPRQKLYRDLAATAQAYFEKDYLGYLSGLPGKYPGFENLIITGGCALNCTSNMKLVSRGVFKEVYVPPFPGDESIALGCAYHGWLNAGNTWTPRAHKFQHGYFGARSSAPEEHDIRGIFRDFEVLKPANISAYCAELLHQEKIIAWFQGRGETGPRALGHRSILASPLRRGLKDFLNGHIKFREDFRPYGSSVLFEEAHLYFEVPEGFDNPFMSFATTVRPEHRENLREVTHADRTSRMQTVRAGSSPRFHALLAAFGEKSGLPVLLNTSLNVMGEPIVETPADAARFLAKVPVDGLAIGDFFIRRKEP